MKTDSTADRNVASSVAAKIEKIEEIRQRLLLPQERDYLIRLCYRLSGDRDVAEDLAQDTLLLAWRQTDTLRDPEAWRSWLAGIARNLYLRWNRSQALERTRRVLPNNDFTSTTTLLEAQIDEQFDLDEALEQEELTRLLGRAMSRLAPPVRDMLVDFYVEDLPQAEIAARYGMTENNAAVRLHRGKRALRKLLTTEMREEAAAFGLVPPEEDVWQETRLWCPFCGQAHLQGRAFGAGSEDKFKVVCPRCSFVMGPRVSDYPGDCIFAHQSFAASRVIHGVRGYKPALNRLNAWWDSYLQSGVRLGRLTCIGCGKGLPISRERPGYVPPQYTWRGLHVCCSQCDKIHVLMPTALSLTAAPVREFWREHPRMRHLPARSLPGGDSFVVTVESVTDTAHLDVIFSSGTCEIIRVEKN